MALQSEVQEDEGILRRKKLKSMIEGTLEEDENNESMDAQTTVNRT